MNPTADIHIQSLVEHIRLLEAFVTAPLGLYSDIKMLRESLPFAHAADLSRDELIQRRSAYSSLSDDNLNLTLNTVSSINAMLNFLVVMRGNDAVIALQDGWIRRARMVLRRTEEHITSEIRAQIAARVRGLYVIVDPEATQGRDVLEVASAALKGGVSVLQLRDKTRDKGEVLATGRELKSLCDTHGALFIINDDADIALACGAHGLHVGQTDLPINEARRVLTPHQLVGCSNNGINESVNSQQQGADYIAVGAVFPTTTMGKSGRTSVGAEMISQVKAVVSQPIVAIGGINADNIAQVARAGADCICVVSAVTHASAPEVAATELLAIIESAAPV